MHSLDWRPRTISACSILGCSNSLDRFFRADGVPWLADALSGVVKAEPPCGGAAFLSVLLHSFIFSVCCNRRPYLETDCGSTDCERALLASLSLSALDGSDASGVIPEFALLRLGEVGLGRDASDIEISEFLFNFSLNLVEFGLFF